MLKREERTLDVQTLVRFRLKNNSQGTAGRRCFCVGDTKILFVPPESEPMTECFICCLKMTHSENVISLLQNYISDEFLAFGSVSLQALVLFLLNTKNSESQKFRIKNVLDDQLRYHPACATYMSETYNTFMLAENEDFCHLTALDFVLGKLEQILFHEKIRNTDHRTSRRRGPPKTFFDDSPKKSKKDFKSLAEESVNVRDVCWVLDFLVQILKHDFGVKVCHRNEITDSIVAKLIFKSGDMLQQNTEFLRKIFEVYKIYCPSELRKAMSDLIFLIADLYTLIEEHTKFDFYKLNPRCHEFLDEFCAVVLNNASSSQTFSIVTQLHPEWLRLHVSHYVIETLVEKKIPITAEGAVHSLHYLTKKTVEYQTEPSSSKAFRNFINDQNTEKMRGIFNVDNMTTKQPDSILLRLVAVYIDSSLKIDKITNISNCSVTMHHRSKLFTILDELNEAGNVSEDFKSLHVLLNNIMRT